MFTPSVSTIAKIWKQPKCPLMDEWIKKLWYVCLYVYIDVCIHCIYVCICIYVYIHTSTCTEVFSAIKRKLCHLQKYEWTLNALC